MPTWIVLFHVVTQKTYRFFTLKYKRVSVLAWSVKLPSSCIDFSLLGHVEVIRGGTLLQRLFMWSSVWFIYLFIFWFSHQIEAHRVMYRRDGVITGANGRPERLLRVENPESLVQTWKRPFCVGFGRLGAWQLVGVSRVGNENSNNPSLGFDTCTTLLSSWHNTYFCLSNIWICNRSFVATVGNGESSWTRLNHAS